MSEEEQPNHPRRRKVSVGLVANVSAYVASMRLARNGEPEKDESEDD